MDGLRVPYSADPLSFVMETRKKLETAGDHRLRLGVSRQQVAKQVNIVRIMMKSLILMKQMPLRRASHTLNP